VPDNFLSELVLLLIGLPNPFVRLWYSLTFYTD